MGLVPVDIPRIIEDLQTAIFALRVLDRVEQLYPEDDLHDLWRRRLVGVGISREDYENLSPDLQEIWYESVDDIHAQIFELQWTDFRIAIRRLYILLNDGDTEILDCDYLTRTYLNGLSGWVENCHIDKPEFVPGGPQVWAGRAGFQAFSGERHLEALGASPDNEAPQAATVAAKFQSASFLPNELASELQISDRSLSTYAKSANVETPGRGKRNHRYSEDDREAICRQIMATGGDSDSVAIARQIIDDLESNRTKTESKSKDRK